MQQFVLIIDTVKNKIPHSFFIRFLLDSWNGSDPCEGFTLADDGLASTTGFTNQLNSMYQYSLQVVSTTKNSKWFE